MIDALMNQSLIARLSECFQEARRSPGSIKFTFHQDVLRDPVSGEFKFCDLIPAVFTRSNITPMNGGEPFQASTTLPIHYTVPKMCNRCFHRGGIAAHSARECPLEGACKWCWKFPDEAKSIGHHITKVCPQIKKLHAIASSKGGSIFPYATDIMVPIASHSSSILGATTLDHETQLSIHESNGYLEKMMEKKAKGYAKRDAIRRRKKTQQAKKLAEQQQKRQKHQ